MEQALNDAMEAFADISPVIGLTWDDLDKVAEVLTQAPLGRRGHQLDNSEVGLILGMLLRHGYTVIKVGPT